jgi:predicted RNA-binding protein with PIN domain
MPYLIDASNLGGVLDGARGARDAERIVAFLVDWARTRGRAVAVFDGVAQPRVAERYGALEVVWSGAGRAADEEIVRRAANRPRDWIVISDDRELRRRCRDLGARVETARAFAHRLERPRRAAVEGGEKPSPSAEDVERWRRIIGDRD